MEDLTSIRISKFFWNKFIWGLDSFYRQNPDSPIDMIALSNHLNIRVEKIDRMLLLLHELNFVEELQYICCIDCVLNVHLITEKELHDIQEILDYKKCSFCNKEIDDDQFTIYSSYVRTDNPIVSMVHLSDVQHVNLGILRQKICSDI